MISINGKILENTYTTAQWASITTPLPDRVWGHEVNAGVPVGSKMGNGIDLWGDLAYWYVGSSAGVIVQSIPSVSDYEYTYDGSLGAYPMAEIQVPNSSADGWMWVAMGELLNNGNILARGDWAGLGARLVIHS